MIYFVLGIKRSGNHAIINWLYKMIPDYVHINNLPHGLITEDNIVKHKKNTYDRNYIDKGWTDYKDNVIISLENAPLNVTVNKIMSVCHVPYKIIVVVRNPKNTLASIWKVYENRKDILETHAWMWLAYAEELAKNTYNVIIYDKWFSDLKYRKLISARLGLVFDDSNFNNIFKHGVSSFDGYKYQNCASKMDVLHRAEYFKGDKYFNSIINNSKMSELWNKIYTV
jgi:hypothetical protein